MFVTPYSTLRAVRTHIVKSPICLSAGLGVKEIQLKTRPTGAMVGGSITVVVAAVQALLGQRRSCDTKKSGLRMFCKIVGLVIYYVCVCLFRN